MMIDTIMYKRGALPNSVLEWAIFHDEGNPSIRIAHGVYGGKTRTDTIIPTMTSVEKEIDSRIKAKRKEGYLTLEEIKDSAPVKIVNNLFTYLLTYLPKYNTANNGNILPMLCKTLENGKPFVKNMYKGQWKINGLRCLIGIEEADSLFRRFNIKFQSREGTTWKLCILEDEINAFLEGKDDIIDLMLHENAYLDGELYIPGCTVNEINHIVKDPWSTRHKDLQYWCYDIAVDNMIYSNRSTILHSAMKDNIIHFDDMVSNIDHMSHKRIINYIDELPIATIEEAIAFRDRAINIGFEGLVMRNISAEYQFGSRKVDIMYKFKKIDDGLFEIVDVVPEGERRQNLGKLILKNDTNDELFECTYNASHVEQERLLTLRNKYIGGKAFVEFRERSGVKQVPFHAKATKVFENGTTRI